MKYIIFLSFITLIFFSQCTPKTGDVMTKTEEIKDTGKEVTTKAKDNFRAMSPTPGPAPKIQLGTYESFDLDNGLKVIVVENHKLPRVSFSLTLDMEPFMEKEYTGAAEMAGQLLSHGTNTKTKAQIDEEVDFMGASMNTSYTGMFGASLTKHSDNLLKIMSDVLLNPSFPEEEFDKIKKQTISGLASSKDNPDAIASNVASVLRYGKDHPYGEVVTEETVDKITLQKVKEYYKNYFKPNIAYLTVVGDITPAEAKTMAQKYFGNWKKGTVPMETYAKPTAPAETTIDFVNKAGAVQSVINVTYPVDFKPGSDDAIKAAVMNTLLGGFFRSRLNGNLREGKGYTYGIRSSLSSNKEIGSFSTSAGVRNEVTDSSVIEILYELNRLRNEKVEEDELNLVKNYLAGSFARNLESPQTVARFALNTIRYNLPKDYYATYLEKLSRVTSADLMLMAQKYLKPDNAHIVVVGNKGEVVENLEKLKTVKFYDNYGNEIVETFEIPEGTTAQTVIDDYLSAIGGKAKLAMVKDIAMKMTAVAGPQSISVDLNIMDGKFSTIVSMGGMGVMSKQIYNNGKALVEQGGQKMPADEATLGALKEAAILFPEMKYAENSYKLKLAGAEKIEGKDAYVIELESADGQKSTHYYAVGTSLKIREVSSQGGQAVSTDLKDYKEVDGIMFPHTNVITGMAPFPLNMTMESIMVNKGVDPAVFKVE